VVNPAGARRGVLATSWTKASADDPVLGSCGDTAVFWHHDVVSRLPEGTRVLARAATGELLAARYAPTVWGVQCHPEARTDIVTGWAAKDRALARSAQEAADVDAALAAVLEARDDLSDSWRPLAAGFAEQVRAHAGVPAH
jgi:GMP synthase (glutamine-hydrolysing)